MRKNTGSQNTKKWILTNSSGWGFLVFLNTMGVMMSSESQDQSHPEAVIPYQLDKHSSWCFTSIFMKYQKVFTLHPSSRLQNSLCLWHSWWFQILYNQHSVEVQGNLERKLITRLQPDTEYSFVLMGRGNSAGGLQQQVSIRTAPDLLKMKPAIHHHDVEEGGRMTVSLPTVPEGAPVRYGLFLRLLPCKDDMIR